MTTEQQFKATSLAVKTALSEYDAEALLTRWKWNYDVALAVWTLATAHGRDVQYVSSKLQWLCDA